MTLDGITYEIRPRPTRGGRWTTEVFDVLVDDELVPDVTVIASPGRWVLIRVDPLVVRQEYPTKTEILSAIASALHG